MAPAFFIYVKDTGPKCPSAFRAARFLFPFHLLAYAHIFCYNTKKKEGRKMKAKYIPRIDLHDVLELKNALPLRTPYVIHIDPCDTCNFHCKFCPSGNAALLKNTKGRGHGPIDFDTYCGIIDDLKDFDDPIRVIRLYKEGEPLLHPRFPELVSYAKASPKVLRVDTTTNASLLSKEKSLQIIEAGLDRINISVEGISSAQYRDFSGVNINLEEFRENIAFFYGHKKQCEVNIKINGDILTPGEEELFYSTFGNISDGISVEHTIDYWPKYKEMQVDYDEGVTLLGGVSKEVQVCPYVFYEMCINSDGSYSLCRFDWNHAMMLAQHVGAPVTPRKIWDSIVLWQFQQSFLKKQRLMMTVLSCPKCGILKQGVPENLDPYAEEILDNM